MTKNDFIEIIIEKPEFDRNKIDKEKILTIDFSKNSNYYLDIFKLIFSSDKAFDEMLKITKNEDDENFIYAIREAQEELSLLDILKNSEDLEEIIKKNLDLSCNNISEDLRNNFQYIKDFYINKDQKTEKLLKTTLYQFLNSDNTRLSIILDDSLIGKIQEICIKEFVDDHKDENLRFVVASHKFSFSDKKENIILDDRKNIDNTKNEKPQKQRDSFKSFFIVFAVVFIIFKFVLMNCFIPSGSMNDTIPTRSFMLANRITYRYQSPQFGDIAIFNSKETGNLLTKRIIGTPGDTIKIHNNKVYVNDKLLDEKYTVGSTIGEYSFKVPKDKFFMMGDNRENSFDSRFWKEPFIDKKDIIAKGFLGYGLPFVSNKIFVKILN